MSVQLRLVDIFPQGEAALRALSPSIAQRVFTLDWSGVATISQAQLDALFAAAPADWTFEAFAEVIDASTLDLAVADQLSAWVEARRAPAPPPPVPAHRARRGEEDDEPVAPFVPPLPPDLPEPPPRAAERGRLHPILALQRVTDEYRSYLQTEFRAKDPTLKASLEAALGQPRFLAQDPFYQAHRPFRAGRRWDELGLDPRLARVMQRRSGSQHAYQHQSEAIQALLQPQPEPVVVTTGTGSGKTETFLLPVIQNAIADASAFNRKPGLTAILIYPMNALANDQFERIKGYLDESGWAGAVEVAQYDRSTNQQRRRELRERPPHILLTNYVMLEYLLVRPADRDAIFANHRCRFLVLDEVHTYRGTLGSNIALLVRRLRAHLARASQSWMPNPPEELRPRRFPALVPVATSATIKSIADETISAEERRRQRDEAVQGFFGKLTGANPAATRVIGEELEELNAPAGAAYPAHPPALPPVDPNDAEGVRRALCALAGLPVDTPVGAAAQHSKLLWDLNRLLVRQPLSLEQIAARLRAEVPARANAEPAAFQAEVEAALLVGAALPEGTPGALRLRAHQLIRGGWQFHRCVNPDCGRLYPMGEATCADCGHPTAPLYLCRSCGAHYLRFVGDDPADPEANPLRPSAVRSDGPEWMLYDPARFPDTVGELDEDDGEASIAPTGNRKQPKQLKGRGVFSASAAGLRWAAVT
jgi:hypothetical protein